MIHIPRRVATAAGGRRACDDGWKEGEGGGGRREEKVACGDRLAKLLWLLGLTAGATQETISANVNTNDNIWLENNCHLGLSIHGAMLQDK